jgi:hypothetical protein
VISIGVVEGTTSTERPMARLPCGPSTVIPKGLHSGMSDDGYARYRKNESYGRGGSSGPSSARGDDDPLAELARLIGQDQPAPPDWRASPAPYEDYQYPSEQQGDSPYYDDAQPSHSQSFNAYGDQHFQAGYGETERQLDPAYEDGRYFGDPGQNSDDDYEEPAPRRSRGGLVTFVVVLCLAGVGTAGAFAYRSLFRGSAGNSPPVILADSSPNKIVPTNQSSDSTGQADSARPDLGNAERMVSREERPLNVDNASSAPTVFPSPAAQPPMAANTPPVLAPAPQAAPPAAPGEPRRVRTVIIRPGQQGDPRVASSNAAFPTGSTGARNANQKPGPPSDGEAPLSLAPQGSPPADSSPAHPKLASTASRPVSPPVNSPAATAAGSFFVQIAAQKSEEDAQTTFRAMQAKYPGQLGGRQLVIRRKDLDKGVFYGVQVGPFASREDAVQLCESLKSAGGSCMIQKN